MAHTSHVTVTITVETDLRPIQGSVQIGGRSRSRFHGWLELNDRLEQALSSAGSPDDLRRPLIGLRTDTACLPDIQTAWRHQL